MFEKPTTFRTFPGVLRGRIYLFYSIQYTRVVILRNTQTHKQRLFELSTEYYVDVYICSTVYSTPEWSYSVTNKHTNTHTNTHTNNHTHKANLKESRIDVQPVSDYELIVLEYYSTIVLYEFAYKLSKGIVACPVLQYCTSDRPRTCCSTLNLWESA